MHVRRRDRMLLSVLGGGLLFLSAIGPAGSLGAEPSLDPAVATPSDDGSILWYDVRDLGVEGQGWTDTKAPFDRLPGTAEGVVRAPVWSLSRHSAGLCVRFATESGTLHVRWTLTAGALAMPHMPATGVSGVDLFVVDESNKLRWAATGKPTRTPTNEACLVRGIPAKPRQYQLYLPLYNGVSSVEIGVPPGAAISGGAPRPANRRKPIVFWGTSITQGGCASRPGAVHTAILGRRLDRPVINLGFSGNGRLEIELADLLAQLDPAVYVIDCLPNVDARTVRERIGPAVARLRRDRPATPIVLAEDRTYSDAFLVPARRERNATSRAELRAAFDRLKAGGDANLYYLDGPSQLGPEGDDTVDGSHPTDLGFFRMADAFEKVLGPILEGQEQDSPAAGE